VTLTDDALALAFRTGLPYVGLRDHEHDPDLDRLIPPDAARAARAVPLGADDDHIRLAVADPEADLSGLTPYVADHEIELALAPREEIDAILGPPLAPERGGTPEAARFAADERAWGDEAEPYAADESDPLTAEPDPFAAGEPEAGTEGDEAEPYAADESDPLTAEPDPFAAGEPEAGSEGDEAEPHTAGEPDPLTAEPDPFAAGEPEAGSEGEEAEAEPYAADEPDPVTADEPQPAAEGPDPLAAEPDPAAVGEAVTPATAPGAPETVASSLAPAGDVSPDEVPSWLEPPSRTRRVFVAVVIAIVLLACAAALVIGFLNA
jgi:hypothetical protein